MEGNYYKNFLKTSLAQLSNGYMYFSANVERRYFCKRGSYAKGLSRPPPKSNPGSAPDLEGSRQPRSGCEQNSTFFTSHHRILAFSSLNNCTQYNALHSFSCAAPSTIFNESIDKKSFRDIFNQTNVCPIGPIKIAVSSPL